MLHRQSWCGNSSNREGPLETDLNQSFPEVDVHNDTEVGGGGQNRVRMVSQVSCPTVWLVLARQVHGGRIAAFLALREFEFGQAWVREVKVLRTVCESRARRLGTRMSERSEARR